MLKTATLHCPKNSNNKYKNNENCPPPQFLSHTLYKKTRNGILGSKTKVSLDAGHERNSIAALLSPTHREGTSKDFAKNMNLLNFYGSPSSLTTLHSSQSKLSKKNSLRQMSIASPADNKERPVHIINDRTCDLVVKKAMFKLNLSKRKQENR